MKKKLIATLATAAIVALAIMPAAFAAPANNCPLKNALTGNAAPTLKLPGTNASTCPKTQALQNLLNGANTGNAASTCPKKAALNTQVNGANTAMPTTLQDLLSKLGIRMPACTAGNCPTGNCTTGNCTTGICPTGNCTTGTCPNK